MYAYFDVTDNQWLRQQRRIDEVGKEEEITFTLGEERFFTRKARMDYLAPNVNTGTGTLRVRARLDNSDKFLKPGSYISIVLPYEKIEQGTLIDDASIGTDQLGSYIYIVNSDSTVEYRHIETGAIVDDTLRVVTSGLRDKERYITKALLKVRNGMKITPIQE
jgi:multidrug efflux pump subunit AcrA (membrane-fusion protein)